MGKVGSIYSGCLDCAVFQLSCHGNLKLSALLIVVFLCCIVSKKVRYSSAVNLRILKGVLGSCVCNQ